jgi:hypothetical protein
MGILSLYLRLGKKQMETLNNNGLTHKAVKSGLKKKILSQYHFLLLHTGGLRHMRFVVFEFVFFRILQSAVFSVSFSFKKGCFNPLRLSCLQILKTFEGKGRKIITNLKLKISIDHRVTQELLSSCPFAIICPWCWTKWSTASRNVSLGTRWRCEPLASCPGRFMLKARSPVPTRLVSPTADLDTVAKINGLCI